MSNLDSLFEPNAIGIVGEVRNVNSWSNRILNNLIDYQYQGEILPVNPGGGTVLGHKVYMDVRDISHHTDLLIVCTPLSQAIQVVEQVVENGPDYVALFSSSYSTDREEAREIHNRLEEIDRETDLEILGPNSSGIFSSGHRLNATVHPDLPEEEGRIAFVSQSGSYGDLLFSQLEDRGLNVGKYISIGAQAGVGHVDILSYLKDDPDTDVIALLVDQIKNGPEFLRIAGETSLSKPIVAFLVSRTKAGIRSSFGVQAEETPQFPVYQAAFEQSGVQLFKDTDDFFDAITVFAGLKQRFPVGDQVGVLSVSGGPATAASDAAEEMNVPVDEFSDDYQEELKEVLPETARVQNPVQIPFSTTDDQLSDLAEVLSGSDEINGLIALNIGFDQESFARPMITRFEEELKPVLSFLSRCDQVKEEYLNEGIPVLPTPERAVQGFKILCKYRDLLAAQKRKGLPDESVFQNIQKGMERRRKRDEGDEVQLDGMDAKEYLEDLDIPLAKEIVTESQKEAVKFGRTTGFPVLVQVYDEDGQDDPDLIYRDVDSIDELESAYLSLRRRSNKEPILVRHNEGPGIELMVRAKRDETFGIVLSVGPGGILTDVLGDVSNRLAPISKKEAKEMLSEINTSQLLDGYQHYPPVDRNEVASVLQTVSDYMVEHPGVQSIELNPMKATEDRPVVLGATVRYLEESN